VLPLLRLPLPLQLRPLRRLLLLRLQNGMLALMPLPLAISNLTVGMRRAQLMLPWKL
jgi:hypothetical protein